MSTSNPGSIVFVDISITNQDLAALRREELKFNRTSVEDNQTTGFQYPDAKWAGELVAGGDNPFGIHRRGPSAERSY